MLKAYHKIAGRKRMIGRWQLSNGSTGGMNSQARTDKRMSRIFLAVGLSILMATIAVDGAAQKQTQRTENRQALVEMEHAFARAAATKGTRDAFLEFLADDGIIFQPGAVNGKKYWTERPARKGLLSWEPEFADISRAADLGYTTGPWEFRPNGPDDKPVAFGEYFTIWKKQNDGSWKAVLDRGVTTDKSYATKVLMFPLNDESSSVRANHDVAAGRTELLKLEADFSARAVAKSATTAQRAYLADDVRMLRQNMAPIIGSQRALEIISSQTGTLSWRPTMADVSASGDLGYTYGTFEVTNGTRVAQHGSYVHVWKKKNRAWKVVIDVASPDPAP